MDGWGLPRSSDMGEDWRLEQLKRNALLRGQRWQRKAYRPRSTTSDHDHCAGCWGKFVVPEKPTGSDEILTRGFAVCADYPRGEGYEWVCPECFGLFKQAMGWTEV